MAEDQWSVRLEAGRDAQTRSRLAFLASTVISVALLIAVFNFQLSWLRTFTSEETAKKATTELQKELQKEIRKEWIDSGRVKISLLGVDLAESDASLLGSFGLFVLTTWFFYCIRRENHLVANLLIDADKNNDDEIRTTVYHGIASYTVFTTIGGDDPIGQIRPAPQRQHSVNQIRPTNVALLFLPAFTIACMIATDVWSLLQVSPARDSTKWLIAALEPREYVQVAVVDGLAIFLLALTFVRCAEILKFERATETILRQFHDLLFAP